MPKKKKTAKSAPPAMPIETAMQELDEIVGELESGTTSLSEALTRFERGMVLLKTCHQQLDQAAQRIELLTEIHENGEISTVPFDGTATADSAGKSDDTDGADGADTSTLF